MDRYLGGEEIDEKVLIADLERAVARATFFPVVPVCSVTGIGCTELLDLADPRLPVAVGAPVARRCSRPPAPRPVRSPATRTGPLVAEVVKTTSDPYVGRLSLVRVFSGTLRPDESVHVSGHFTSFFGEDSGHADHDEDEKIGALSHPFGRTQVPATRVVAGDLCAIGRLSRAETGDTLSSVDDPRVLMPWSLPEPLLPVAIVAQQQGRRRQAVPGAAPGSPPRTRACAIDNNAETHQLVLWCMGEAHSDVVLERLAGRFSVHVDRCRSSCRCARRSPGRPRARAGTSSSPAATASTPCATSRWSRCPRARASSSSTRSSAARCPGSSSRASRRACARRWSAASATATRSSTCG